MKKAGLRPITVGVDSIPQKAVLQEDTRGGAQGRNQVEPGLPGFMSRTAAGVWRFLPAVSTRFRTLSRSFGRKTAHVDSRSYRASVTGRDTMLSVFYDVAQAVTSGLSLQEILDRIVQASAYLLAVDAAAVKLVDNSTEELSIKAACGLSEETGPGTRIASGTKPTRWVVDNQRTLIINDMFSDDEPDLKELAGREDVRSYLGVPLTLRGRCIGAIEVYSRRSLRHFTEEDIECLTTLGDQAAIAIENARLYQAERDTATKLQQLERHKSDFMSMVAHELRTPLTSIKGFAQLLQRQNSPSDADGAGRYLSIIEAESNRMIRIINDILDISRMEAGLLQMCKQPLSLSDLIQEVVESAGVLCRGHAIEVSLPKSLPMVHGDAAKIEQILVNLISNAVKYSPDGEPVQIGASADEEGVTVWVNDRGRGIPADKFDHIFNKYKIIDYDSDFGKSKSSGLGLYISKNFVEAHGGKMWVESEEGKGAKFLFKLYY